MNPDRWSRLRELFAEALGLAEGERNAFLDRETIGQPELRAEVERLLAADGDADSFLSPRARPTAHGSIGPYDLLEIVGEGGFGVVWLAEQHEPIRRRVALKLIKPGMDSRQIVARFEAERQALALMDHPGIAQVFEAGATETGRPYFAMEYVDGLPITAFCDRERLSVRGRLELFATVCDAVQHAHQKGIIHRDLKPSNVLARARDGVPSAKVIDFGVVKATTPATTGTLLTREGMIVGTLGYMSPEQAGAIEGSVDTRSDIYSLGVMLYELLAGVTPFDPERLSRSPLSEALRVVGEEDPPALTAQLTRSEEVLAAAAERRSSSPRRLLRDLTGELQWITLRALEKQPDRRYPSAAELAADVRRHLADEPVLAAAPSTIYRLRKLARRHRVGVAAAALVLLAIVAGGVAAGVGFRRAVRAEQVARREAESSRQVADFLVDLFGASNPDRAKGVEVTARQLLDEGTRRIETGLADDPLVRARVLTAMKESYQGLGDYEEGVHLAREALAAARSAQPRPGIEVARRLFGLAHALSTVARDDSVIVFVDEAIAILEASDEGDDRLLADCLGRKAVWCSAHGRGALADSLAAAALAVAESAREPDRSQLIRLHANNGYLANLRFDLPEAERQFTRELELAVETDQALWIQKAHGDLAGVYQTMGDVEQLIAHAEESLRLARQIYPPDSPQMAQALHSQMFALLGQERIEEAIAVMEEAVAIERASGTPGGLSWGLNSLGILQLGAGHVGPALASAEEAAQVCLHTWGAEHSRSAEALANLAKCHAAAKHAASADSSFRAAVDVFARLHDTSILAIEANLGYATFCRDEGWMERADSFFVRTEAVVDTSSAGLRPYLGTCLMEHGYLRSLQDRSAEAEAMMRDGFRYRSADVAEDDPDLGYAYLTWAAARARAGDPDGAVERLARAVGCAVTEEDVAEYGELAALRSRPDYPVVPTR